MDSYSDPSLVAVKVTIPGQDGTTEDVIRKFKFAPTELERDTIHHTVLYLLLIHLY